VPAVAARAVGAGSPYRRRAGVPAYARGKIDRRGAGESRGAGGERYRRRWA